MATRTATPPMTPGESSKAEPSVKSASRWKRKERETKRETRRTSCDSSDAYLFFLRGNQRVERHDRQVIGSEL